MQRSHWAGCVLAGCLAVHCGGGDEASMNGIAGSGTGGVTGGTGGGSSAGSDSGGDAGSRANGAVACPDDIEDLAAAVAEAICAKRAECCDDAVEACVAEVTEAFEVGYPDLARAERNGSVALDCGAFDDCAAAVAASRCDEWPYQASLGIPADEAACYAFLTPLSSDSEACRYSYECEGGYCRVLEGESIGICYAYAGENEACGEAGEPDQLCDPESMFCNQAGLCQRRLRRGATCTANDECESLVCDTQAGGTCVAPGEAECEYSIATAATNCSFTPAGLPLERGSGLLLALSGLLGLRCSRQRFGRSRARSGRRSRSVAAVCIER